MSKEKRKEGQKQTEYHLLKKKKNLWSTENVMLLVWWWREKNVNNGMRILLRLKSGPDVQQCQSGWGKKTSLLPFRRDKPKVGIGLERSSRSKDHSISLRCTTQCPQTKLQPPGTKHSWHTSGAVLRIQSKSPLCLSMQLMEISKHYHELIWLCRTSAQAQKGLVISWLEIKMSSVGCVRAGK